VSSFQSESKKTGDEYETIVEMDLVDRGFDIYHRDYHVEGTGCEVDFIAGNNGIFLEYVEAKGGQRGFKKRPGAKRTDNVKKAIANAALIKTKDPSIYYVVYFSSEPKPGSYSEEMINTALKSGIINEVRYKRDITYLIKQFWNYGDGI
jgi:hypothetical protein